MDVKTFYQGKNNEQSRGSVNVAPAVKNNWAQANLPKCHLRLKHPKRQLDPDVVWRVFPRQQMAFDFAKTCWQSVAVFAFESEELGHQGQRKYLVTTYYHFSQKYLVMNPPRHFYEVITEGVVCRLYFDIEFKLNVNPDVPPIPTLETFIKYVCYQLSVSFRLSCDRCHILDLDSSTEHKFSRHLIFHLPNAVFTNNIHAGSWVHHICDLLRNLKRASERGVAPQQVWTTTFTPNTPACPPAEDLLTLFVCTENGSTSLICDEGVYTRNRNFRLFLSSKLGKTSCLTLARENKFKSASKQETRKTKLVNVFMDSLICNVSYGTSQHILSFEPCGTGRRGHPKPAASSASASSEGYSTSPYPLVDGFITSCVGRGGVQGAIRRWNYFQQEKLLVYDIKHNRWCENIQRAHKSNNIMIIADLQRGTYYQKCHDPDCKRINFKSNEYPIPVEVNPAAAPDQCSQHNSASAVKISASDTTADITTGGSDSEWLSDVSLEELLDYSLEGVGGGGGSDGGAGLDDEAILDRVADEMDLDLSDTSATASSRLAAVTGTLNLAVVESSSRNAEFSQKDTAGMSGDHSTGGFSGTVNGSCVATAFPDHEDSLFDRAYDIYESDFKIT